jgi:hypothetical protein
MRMESEIQAGGVTLGAGKVTLGKEIQLRC